MKLHGFTKISLLYVPVGCPASFSLRQSLLPPKEISKFQDRQIDGYGDDWQAALGQQDGDRTKW